MDAEDSDAAVACTEAGDCVREFADEWVDNVGGVPFTCLGVGGAAEALLLLVLRLRASPPVPERELPADELTDDAEMFRSLA